MLKKISNKQKIKYAGILFVLLLFACYKLSIVSTINEYKKYRQIKKSASLLDTSFTMNSTLKSKQKHITDLFESYSLDTLQNTSDLLSIVTEYCNDSRLKLSDYKPLKTSAYDSIRLLTRVVTVEGEFIGCLQLVHALETRYKAGRVSSVNYKASTDPNNKSLRLSCTIYIQNII